MSCGIEKDYHQGDVVGWSKEPAYWFVVVFTRPDGTCRIQTVASDGNSYWEIVECSSLRLIRRRTETVATIKIPDREMIQGDSFMHDNKPCIVVSTFLAIMIEATEDCGIYSYRLESGSYRKHRKSHRVSMLNMTSSTQMSDRALPSSIKNL